MAKVVQNLATTLTGFRSNTLSPAFIETVNIDGSPLKFLGHVSTAKNLITILVYDQSISGKIITALKAMNLNAFMHSKNMIAVSIPPVSGDERQKVCDRISKLGEDAKVAVRMIRKKLRNALTKDDLKQQDDTIQKATDEHIKRIDELVAEKLRFILS